MKGCSCRQLSRTHTPSPDENPAADAAGVAAPLLPRTELARHCLPHNSCAERCNAAAAAADYTDHWTDSQGMNCTPLGPDTHPPPHRTTIHCSGCCCFRCYSSLGSATATKPPRLRLPHLWSPQPLGPGSRCRPPRQTSPRCLRGRWREARRGSRRWGEPARGGVGGPED